jgi:hypothetical protein
MIDGISRVKVKMFICLESQEDSIEQSFRLWKTDFVSKDVPVIIDEFTATELSGHVKARNHSFKIISRFAQNEGIPPIFWDNGNVDE